MRIIAVHPGPNFSVQDVYVGWTHALVKSGQKVLGFNLDDRLTFFDNAYMRVSDREFRKALPADQAIDQSIDGLYSFLYRYHPDVLFIACGFLVPNDLLDLARYRGTKVVVLHTESPYEDERQIEQAQHADVNLINDPLNLDKFPPNTIYVPHAYRPGFHCPGDRVPDLLSDFCFVGTGFKSRIDLFEDMDFGDADVLLGGNWQQIGPASPLRKYVAHDIAECLDNEQTVQVYRAGKVGLNYYRREFEGDVSGPPGVAMGPREVEMAATGLFFLRDPRPEGDGVLDMLPTFTSPEEASDLLAYWLAHPAERADRAAAAREAVKDWTFDRNVQLLIDQLEGNDNGSYPRA